MARSRSLTSTPARPRAHTHTHPSTEGLAITLAAILKHLRLDVGSPRDYLVLLLTQVTLAHVHTKYSATRETLLLKISALAVYRFRVYNFSEYAIADPALDLEAGPKATDKADAIANLITKAHPFCAFEQIGNHIRAHMEFFMEKTTFTYTTKRSATIKYLTKFPIMYITRTPKLSS
ncbi:unnamed protein product [Trichogramma brassicae]|uniref:Uncharacterized protein n=1 Tax=Trichogramma brassicae TaxID=86971 RepID=A0A6H5IK77_9HYME|nr:unnamed protein product [Trichogramma brassicae]